MPDTFSYAPSFSSAKASAPRVLTAAFGDGYQQDVVDGINANLKTWELSFTNRTTSDVDSIETFLSAHLGVAFSWTPPGGSASLWKCKAWRRTPVDYGVDSLTATFQEVLG